MAYGILKCDTITFTDAGVDKSVTISGLVQNPTFSGNITVTGTVSGNTMRGQTVSGATITGGAAAFTTVTGGVVTITSGVFALGSASNPSISFSGDANSGLYSPGADQVAISTNGTGRLFVDASGNVGIGATPNTTFELTTLNDTANSNPATLRFRDTDTSQQLGQIAGRIQFYSSDNTGPIGVYGEIRGLADGVNGTGAVVIATGTAGSAIEHFRVSNGGATSLTSDSGTSPLVVNISSTEVARIDSSGRLLVGTSSSLSAGLIETAGTTFVTSAVVARNTGNDSNPTGFVGAKIRGTSIVQSGDKLVGFVGRGYDGSTYLDAGFVSVEVDGTPGANDMPGRLVFSTTADGASTPTERMRISSSGNVGIGTTTVDSLLHVSEPTNTSVDLLLVARGGNSLSSEVRFLTRNSGGTNVGGAIGYGTSGLTLTASATTIDTAQNVVIDTSGRLLVGTSSTSADTLFRVQGKQSSSASNGVIQIARGQTNPASGNGLGWVDFTDAAGSVGANIRAETELNWGASDYPSRLVFSTTADGASSPTERMRISSSGNVGIGTTPVVDLDVAPAASTATFRIHARSNTTPVASIELVRGTNTTFGADGSGDYRIKNDTGNLSFEYGDAGVTTERARIDSSGRLLVGTSSASTTSTTVFQGNSGGATSHAIANLQRGATNPGTNLSLGFVQFADSVGSVGAQVYAQTDAAWASGSYPGRLVFSTTADGASSPTERLRITNDGVKAYDQTAPAAVNATATLTVANLKTGIITSTSALATDMTLPTGTDTQAGFSGTYDNFTFEWSVINTGLSLVRVLAGTAHTIVGSGSVATGTSGRFASRRTAANTFVTYRLS